MAKWFMKIHYLLNRLTASLLIQFKKSYIGDHRVSAEGCTEEFFIISFHIIFLKNNKR
jgi:hypothetical protein